MKMKTTKQNEIGWPNKDTGGRRKTFLKGVVLTDGLRTGFEPFELYIKFRSCEPSRFYNEFDAIILTEYVNGYPSMFFAKL